MHKIVHIARPITGVGLYISLLNKHLDNGLFETFLISNKQEDSAITNTGLDERHLHIDLQRALNPIIDMRCLLQLIRHLRKLKPDLIHCHSAKAGILGRLAGAYLKIPTLYTPHAYSYLSARNSIKKGFFKWIEKSFKYLPSKTLACSTSEYNRTLTDLKFNKEKVLVWNNSIEPYIQKEESAIKLSLPNRFLCAIVRVSHQKNIEMLLNLMAHLKMKEGEISLVLIGVDNSLTKKLRDIIDNKRLTDSIHYLPWLNRDELMYVISKSFLYVSSSRYEGLPYAVIEAMSLGKPCVVTDVDGNNDLITNGYNGYLVELDNSTAMADKVEILLHDAMHYNTMSKNATNNFSEKYTVQKNIKNLENIYLSQIIKGR